MKWFSLTRLVGLAVIVFSYALASGIIPLLVVQASASDKSPNSHPAKDFSGSDADPDRWR